MLRLVCTALFLFGSALQSRWPPATPVELPRDEAAGPLPSSIEAEWNGPGRWLCTFRFRPPAGARDVHLAGTFNGWSRDATPLRRTAAGGWGATLDLDAGTHLYKFVVGDTSALGRQRWIQDPDNPESVDDDRGGRNSVLRLGELARLTFSGASTGDGELDPRALEHAPDRPLYLQHLARGAVLVRYRTLAHDVEGVELAVRGRDPARMARVLRGDLYDYWEATVSTDEASPADESDRPYTFVLTDGALRVSDPETYHLAPPAADAFRTPEWTKHAIWYQVMVDRFWNGRPENDPDPVRPWRSEWFSHSPWEGQDGQTFYRYFVFSRLYGGDLHGLQEKLGYLRELGVNALYLNPIFQSPSHHKYDATNYLHVDEYYGVQDGYAAAEAGEDLLDPATWVWTESDRIFLDFLKEAKSHGFRVVIDGVFNHVGTDHPAFRDVREKGAESRFADWFDVRSWDPFRYEGWGGFGGMPAFKKSESGLASESLKQHLFALTRRWMDPDGDGDPGDGVDGWRLDVPNEIPLPFWEEWRALVKSINPDAYIAGEIWERADEWLDGRTFDAVMNYPFAANALAWIGNQNRKIKPGELDRRLAELRLAYPAEVTYALMNLVGSHDTDRIASRMRNPDRPYDGRNRNQDGAKYDESKPESRQYKKARLVALLQMTYVGAPMIYYGDEVGMWGADDPSNRKPMLWSELEPFEASEENHVHEEQLAFYRRAVALRNEHPALRTGSFRTLLAGDEHQVWVFAREDGSEQLIVALNGGGRRTTVRVPELDVGWECVIGEEARTPEGELVLPPFEGRVFLKELR